MYLYSVANITTSNIDKLKKYDFSFIRTYKPLCKALEYLIPLCTFPAIYVPICLLLGSMLTCLGLCILYSLYAHVIPHMIVFPMETHVGIPLCTPVA